VTQLPFHPATAAWFEASFDGPTEVQQRGWAEIAAGHDALLIAPTGSGKTLAAFLWAIDRLGQRAPDDDGKGVRVLYISPLKALVHDIERNLRAPLVGIGRAAARLGEPFEAPRVSMRTGDTSQKERRDQLRDPGEILVTTPESLYLLLGSKAGANLRTVRTVIVDEVHAMAGRKRGVHLALSLERLEEAAAVRPQRIGLSATVRPVQDIARFLGGATSPVVVDASGPPKLDLKIVVPLEDMERPPPIVLDEGSAPRGGGPIMAPDSVDHGADGMGYGSFQQQPKRAGIWPSITPKLVALIQAHRTTLVFVNSRALCEKLARRLNEEAGEELVRSHHGSVSHSARAEVEEALKEGRLKAIVATSSLELGIDMGAIDLVVLVESPGSTARGLQRVGRAGHKVGETSVGRLFPKFRGDLLEATVVAGRMLQGELEPISIPRNALDVLAQQIVAMCSMRPWTVDDLLRLVRRAFPYRELSRDALCATLDMLAGRYPSTDFADLRPRLVWDRDADLLTARPGAKMVALVNGGTIPDRGLYGVYIAPDGPRVGELDEEMVHESRAGETFVLGATTWRVEEIQRDRVLVSPAAGLPGKLPFWKGEGPGRPIELGRAIGAFLRDLDAVPAERQEAWLVERFPVDLLAARNLRAYVAEQKEHAGVLPTDSAITVERFRDELGDWRVCILTPFGGRVHAPWALALEAKLSDCSGFDIQTMWSDDGIVLRFADSGDEAALPEADDLILEPEELDHLLLEQLARSALFAGLFRENAARSLLMTRKRPGQRMPLWLQRLKSSRLLAVAKQYPAFPVILETYRSCLNDVFDLPSLNELLSQVRRREVRVDVVETPSASPFARSLVFAFVASYIYETDAPLAERRAQALNLDRNLLRELMGGEELRDLLDAAVLERVGDELQFLSSDRRVRTPDALHDLLRRLGDLSAVEVGLRCEQDPADWLEQLQDERRAVLLRVAGQERWIAVEDVALYRDALGCVPPAGLPAVFLEEAREAPLPALLKRYARTHGPFTTAEAAARFGLLPAHAEPALVQVEGAGSLLKGEFRPGGSGSEWCDADVLRRLRRRTLSKLRGEVAPVDAAVLARFLAGWHGLGGGRRGKPRLGEVIDQLEGVPLPFSELESRILPARVPDFRPAMLDELGAMGELCWIGRSPLGSSDGKVALYRRDRVALLPANGEAEVPDGPLHQALLAHLRGRGASFLVELQRVDESAPLAELTAALWDLVWAGLVTNDTFAPLRTLGGKGPRRSAGRRGGRIRRGQVPGAGGRWSLVEHLVGEPLAATERAHAWAVMLLERYGVVSREAAHAEGLPGGFSAVYPVLQAMEEGGRVRRGYFVDGLGGAQFALPGAVDRLRAARRPGDEPEIRVLAATDPGNPWGALLPWPDRGEVAGSPSRRAGATLVLADGAPLLFVDKGGRTLLTFGEPDDRLLVPALAALGDFGALGHKRLMRVEKVDGEGVRRSRLREPMLRAGFVEDHRGMRLDRR
jgi:ATP-dependent helicase Lhr and Lhr-like helicase